MIGRMHDTVLVMVETNVNLSRRLRVWARHTTMSSMLRLGSAARDDSGWLESLFRRGAEWELVAVSVN